MLSCAFEPTSVSNPLAYQLVTPSAATPPPSTCAARPKLFPFTRRSGRSDRAPRAGTASDVENRCPVSETIWIVIDRMLVAVLRKVTSPATPPEPLVRPVQ